MFGHFAKLCEVMWLWVGCVVATRHICFCLSAFEFGAQRELHVHVSWIQFDLRISSSIDTVRFAHFQFDWHILLRIPSSTCAFPVRLAHFVAHFQFDLRISSSIDTFCCAFPVRFAHFQFDRHIFVAHFQFDRHNLLRIAVRHILLIGFFIVANSPSNSCIATLAGRNSMNLRSKVHKMHGMHVQM